MDQFHTLKKAILELSPISYHYNKPGKSPGKRIGYPYVIFVLTDQNGSKSMLLDLVQIEGMTDFGQKPLPDFTRDELYWFSDIEILKDAQAFTPTHSEYNPLWDGYENVMAKAST